MKVKDHTSQCHQSTSSSPFSVQLLLSFRHYLNASGPFEDLLMSEEASKGRFQEKTTIIQLLWESEILNVRRDDEMG